MNEIQKQQITKLREEGVGYTKIAKHLNISINTVKSFCKRNKLGGVMVEGRTKKRCEECLSIIEKARADQRFCSSKCRHQWWNSNRNKASKENLTITECPTCHQMFFSYPSQQRKYCSHKCYIKGRFDYD